MRIHGIILVEPRMSRIEIYTDPKEDIWFRQVSSIDYIFSQRKEVSRIDWKVNPEIARRKCTKNSINKNSNGRGGAPRLKGRGDKKY